MVPPTLTTGQTVTLQRYTTRQTAAFLIHEMQEYKGAIAVYGETQRHGIVIGPGAREVQGRVGLFVFVPQAKAIDIERFGDAIGGSHIGLTFSQPSLINVGQTALPEGTRYYPIISTPLPCWYGPALALVYVNGLPRPVAGQKTKLLELGRQTIDLWLAWQAHGQRLPPEARALKAMSTERNRKGWLQTAGGFNGS